MWIFTLEFFVIAYQICCTGPLFFFLFCESLCLSTASEAANPQPRSGHVELPFMHNNMVRYHQFHIDQLTVVFLAVFLTSRVHYCPVIIHFHSIIFFGIEFISNFFFNSFSSAHFYPVAGCRFPFSFIVFLRVSMSLGMGPWEGWSWLAEPGLLVRAHDFRLKAGSWPWLWETQPPSSSLRWALPEGPSIH